MEIQSNATAASLFESLSQKEGAGAKGDMFASMMNRILTEAANRKREQAEAQARADAESADRKAPIRADRPKPRAADASAQPPRAPEKVEPPRAKDRPEPKAEAKNDAPPRADKAEAPDRDHQAPKADKADKAERTAKKDATDGTRKTGGAETKDAPTDQTAATEDAPQDTETKVAAEGDAQDSSEPNQAEGDEVVVIDAELTITETTIEVITDEGAFALAMTEETATLAIEGAGNGVDPAAVDALKAVSDDTGAAQPTTEVDPAAQLAAAQAAQAAQAAAQAPQEAATAGADASKAAEVVHAAKPVEAAPVETMPGELAADALPKSDEDAPLPGNLAELAAAAKKGLDKAGAKGDGDAGSKNDGQNQGGNPALAQLQTQPAQTGESAKSTSETAFAAAVAAAADAPATAKPAEAAAPTSTHPAIAAMEAPRGAAGVDGPQATAHLRPSRGSAAMPQGVHEQMAVHIQKNVSDGNDQFTINLRPVEMGRIDIRLEIAADGRVSAMVAVEKAQTLELLQRDSRNLERALQDAGLKADSDSLNFSLRGEGGSPFQDDARQGGSGRRGRRGGSGGEVEDVTAAYTATLAPGRVDIHA